MHLNTFLKRTLCATATMIAISSTPTGRAATDAERPSTRVRAEIPAEYRWDFSAIYPDWPAWEADMQRMDTLMAAFVQLKGTLKGGPEALLKATGRTTKSASCSTACTAIRSCSAMSTAPIRRSPAASSA